MLLLCMFDVVVHVGFRLGGGIKPQCNRMQLCGAAATGMCQVIRASTCSVTCFWLCPFGQQVEDGETEQQ